jgi:hypothetical protein
MLIYQLQKTDGLWEKQWMEHGTSAEATPDDRSSLVQAAAEILGIADPAQSTLYLANRHGTVYVFPYAHSNGHPGLFQKQLTLGAGIALENYLASYKNIPAPQESALVASEGNFNSI